MSALDAVESFVFQADFPGRANSLAAIFGNHGSGVYRLTPLDSNSPHVEVAAARGLYFIGVIGFLDGVPTAALDYPIDAATSQRLTTDFVSRFIRSLAGIDRAAAKARRRAYLPGGAVDFLERLLQLPDERPAL
jgi:hypothetical protein